MVFLYTFTSDRVSLLLQYNEGISAFQDAFFTIFNRMQIGKFSANNLESSSLGIKKKKEKSANKH